MRYFLFLNAVLEYVLVSFGNSFMFDLLFTSFTVLCFFNGLPFVLYLCPLVASITSSFLFYWGMTKQGCSRTENQAHVIHLVRGSIVLMLHFTDYMIQLQMPNYGKNSKT